MNLQPACVCVTTRQRGPEELPSCSFTLWVLLRIIAVDAVMVIATGNGVVKEDIAAKLEVHGAYSLGQ